MPEPDPAAHRGAYWNQRYRKEPSRYGDAPNQFVAAMLEGLAPCRILDAACGQGRNAVWLASQGHQVTAVDISDVAVRQARELAESRAVAVDFEVADLAVWDPGARRFDLVLLSYLQLPAPQRTRIHERVRAFLVPGGRVFLIAHHSDNIEYGVGGPQYPEVLYREDDVAGDFAGFIVERNEKVYRTVATDGGDRTAIDLLFVARSPSPA